MVFTNPGGISNSGASNFTNQKGTIHKLNLNLVINGDSQYYYVGSSPQNSNGTSGSQNDYRLVLAQQKLSSRFNKLKNEYDDI
jgi:hypothetical protein